MALLTYEQKLKDPRWRKKRKLVLERDNYTCALCGDKADRPHVHHLRYVSHNPWDSPIEDLGTLCDRCHFLTHKNPKLLRSIRRKQPIRDESFRYGRVMKLGQIMKDWYKIGGSNG